MSQKIRRLIDEFHSSESGEQSSVLTDDDNAKVVLFAFAAEDGLKEHVAPLTAIIQIIKGEAELAVGEEAVARKPGELGFRRLPPTSDRITASQQFVMLLMRLK